MAAAAPEAETSLFATTLVLTIIGMSLIVWVAIVTRLVRREPLMPLWPRRAVPWSWLFTLAAFLLYIAVSVAVLMLARFLSGGGLLVAEPQTTEELTPLLASTAVAGAISTVLTLLALMMAAGASKIDLGFDTRWLKQDLLYGLAGFVTVVPVVFFIKWILLPFSQENHPLERMVREHPTPSLLFWTVVVAVVAAPWVEEFLLRVVFQGWLERCFFFRQAPQQSEALDVVDAVLVSSQPSESPFSDSRDSPNPYATPLTDFGTAQYPPSAFQATGEPEPAELHEQIVPLGWRAAAPILISSIVFAGMHVGHGIDPIPLFFLALVLGWLYQRTHRLWPCVVLHTALNATSVALLFSML